MNVVELQRAMDVAMLLVYTVVSKVVHCYFILVISYSLTCGLLASHSK